MSRVYLIKVPHEYHIHDRNWPLGLLYICSYLRSKNVDVSIIDLSGLPKDQWNLPLDGDYYGVSCTTPDYHHAVKIAEILREKTSAMLILGGVHATARPREVLSTSLYDVVVVGEGEITMGELASGKDLSNISGIYYRDGDTIKCNPSRPFVVELDSLPAPYIEDLDYSAYVQPIIIKDAGSKGVALITARGCPYQCIFCASDITWHRTVRFHSVGYIIDEISSIMKLGIKSFFFCDDTLLIKKERTYSLLKEFKRLGITWRCSATTNMITPEIARDMAKAGCRQIDFGIESGSDRMLKIMKKGSRVEQNLAATKIAREAGIMTKSMLMVGLPGETEDDVLQTIRFVHESASDMYTVNVFVPLPGSDVADNMDKYKFGIDKNIPYEKYFIVGADKHTPIVHENKEQIARWRDMVWDAIGEKATVDIIRSRDCTGEDNDR